MQFDDKRRASPDPSLRPLVEESVKAAGLLMPGSKPPALSDQQIIEMIFFPVVNEGCRVVAEGALVPVRRGLLCRCLVNVWL